MSAVFADTLFYLALLSDRDQHHQQATALSATLRRPVVTTEFVLLEVANAFSDAQTRALFVKLLPHLRADVTVAIISATADLFEAGCNLYRQRPDKDWSLTDSISFIVMQQRKLSEALTTDRHFKQAGFTILLTSEE